MSSGESNSKAEALKALIRVVEEFRVYDPKMELGQLLIYLMAAHKPGIKMTELTEHTGLSRSAVSRNVLALSEQTYLTGTGGEPIPGHDLVTQVSDPDDARSKRVLPTRHGQLLAGRIATLLRDTSVTQE